MRDTAGIILNSVKAASAQYGLAKLTTRNISETAGVNDALIFRYFRDKEDLLHRAYVQESNTLFERILAFIDEMYSIPFSFRDKARLFFHKTWRELISDPERVIFLTSYYHSGYFRFTMDCHTEQVGWIRERLGKLLPDEQNCLWIMYSLMALLYDSAKFVTDGFWEDSPEVEERVFSMAFAILGSQLNLNDLTK